MSEAKLSPASGCLAYDTPAGKPLDALIAEHLFEWVEIDRGWGCPRPKMYRHEIPAYSSSGSSMLSVLEKMAERGFRYQILKTPRQCHMVSFESRSGDVDTSAFCDSLPEAVCRAALQAALPKQDNSDSASSRPL
jgi:hypothetical protein